MELVGGGGLGTHAHVRVHLRVPTCDLDFRVAGWQLLILWLWSNIVSCGLGPLSPLVAETLSITLQAD